MASKNKITEMIAAIKTIYPYYAKDGNVATLVNTWDILLKDYTDEAINVAFYNCLQTCKMPPTPADVIEKLKAMQQAAEPTEEELWNTYCNALRAAGREIPQFSYTYVDATGISQGEQARRRFQNVWDKLPDTLQSYIGGISELRRMAQTYNDDDLMYEKTRFMKTMPIIQKRKEYTQMHLLLGGAEIGRLTE